VLCGCFFFFLWISPCVWPNSGFWCCVFLNLWITLVLLASFYFLMFGRKIHQKLTHLSRVFFQKEVAKFLTFFSFGERIGWHRSVYWPLLLLYWSCTQTVGNEVQICLSGCSGLLLHYKIE
jgi:hypothetical protein